ncbi:hypothetical protein N5J77_29615 [Sphingobium yanoikuyae]|uniref:APCDD1 domain-containing protein n=1 Tax=Sphingobium yanoikuyae TaxID=13690 RepID=A0AA43BBA2_SPHYA|nr:hypothetical protein [Sphingobium yanoikuyae]MDH2135286.1 hypothetical protein [Sphingobium yanoikuyae]MDH2153504.1 hypothetical protein [Sphingobium yanoikuyae]MDH2170637.1 hypothetical protein [Sphingobium yanoikuyae]
MMMFALAGFVLAVGTTASASQPQPNSLMGNWISECQPIGKDGRHGIITRVTLADGQVEAETQMFATSECKAPVLKVNYRGAATIQQANNGSVSIDHSVDQIDLTPQAPDVVAQYNLGDEHGCGLDGWQINVPKSVAGRRCNPFSFPLKGTTLFDSAWIDGNGLRFGAFPMIWTNTIADRRPTGALPATYRRAVD